MNSSEPLALRDIHVPDSVSWWPLAPGWWILLTLILIAALIVYLLRRRQQSTRSKKIALQTLNEIERDFRQHRDGTRLVRELSALLRRVCLTHYPRQKVAGLTGELWLEFLDSKHQSDAFSKGVGRRLITAPYQADPEIEAEALIVLCRTWVESAARRQT